MMEMLRSNFEYQQILGIANKICFYSQYREIPLATVGNHMGTYQIPLDTFGNPEYWNYFFLNVFSDGHEVATKDGDHREEHLLCLFEQIPPKYKYTVLATIVGNPNTVKYPAIWWYLGCQHLILNTAKYYMGTSLKAHMEKVHR